MEFSGLEAPPDPRKPARLRANLRRLGYCCESENPSWVGPRPILPDYLPGIGRAPGAARLFYAIGHQHLGLTLAPVTADLVGALVSGREAAHDVTPFDLRRFNCRGSPRPRLPVASARAAPGPRAAPRPAPPLRGRVRPRPHRRGRGPRSP